MTMHTRRNFGGALAGVVALGVIHRVAVAKAGAMGEPLALVAQAGGNPTEVAVWVGLAIAAIVVLFIGFKVAKAMVKTGLILAILGGVALAVWWYFRTRQGGM